MRKYLKITAAVLVLLQLTVASCKKSFLEVTPKGKLVAVTFDDYNTLMNGSVFYASGNAAIWSAATIMGDEVSAEETYYNGTGSTVIVARALFRWDDDVFLPLSNSSAAQPYFLQHFNDNIYTVNKIINETPNAAGGTSAQKLELIAEAMASRAFTYFQLINYFGKPYVAATASTDPGYPIITAADITANNFKRNSVQEVYDFMIHDLTTAIPNLQLQPPVATRMSKAAAEGILGKVYLFMGRYADALAIFNAAFSDLGKMSTPPRLYDYNVRFAAGGTFLPISSTTGPNSPFNNLTDLTESVIATMAPVSSNGYANDLLTISAPTVALYDPADWRLKFFTNVQKNKTIIPGGRLRKYGVKYIRMGLELSDLYLLRAECKARLNDLAGAKTDVETLRKTRMPVAKAPVPANTAADQTSLIKFIIDERTREFAEEGYRWFDMRRLAADPLFSGDPAPVHTLYLNSGGVTQFTLRPARLALRIPPYYLLANPGMVDNP